MTRNFTSHNEETGAVLLIVLFFVLGIGLSLAALIGLAGTNLLATGQVQTQRNDEYAADTAMDGAIQACRSVPPNPPNPPTCPNFPITGSFSVDQNNSQNPIQLVVTPSSPIGVLPGERIVEFVVCNSPTAGFSSCLTNALLVATVEYTDTGCTTGDLGCSQYGATVTIENWLIQRANN